MNFPQKFTEISTAQTHRFWSIPYGQNSNLVQIRRKWFVNFPAQFHFLNPLQNPSANRCNYPFLKNEEKTLGFKSFPNIRSKNMEIEWNMETACCYWRSNGNGLCTLPW